MDRQQKQVRSIDEFDSVLRFLKIIPFYYHHSRGWLDSGDPLRWSIIRELDPIYL